MGKAAYLTRLLGTEVLQKIGLKDSSYNVRENAISLSPSSNASKSNNKSQYTSLDELFFEPEQYYKKSHHQEVHKKKNSLPKTASIIEKTIQQQQSNSTIIPITKPSAKKTISLNLTAKDKIILNADALPKERIPLGPIEWLAMLDDDGKLKIPVAELKRKVKEKGLHFDIRALVWPYLLLGDNNINSNSIINPNEYSVMKKRWFDTTLYNDRRRNSSLDQLSQTKNKEDNNRVGGENNNLNNNFINGIIESEHLNRINKDVLRNDRDHVFFQDSPDPNWMKQHAHEYNPNATVISPLHDVWAKTIEDTVSVETRKHLEMLRDILITYSIYDKEIGYVQGKSETKLKERKEILELYSPNH